ISFSIGIAILGDELNSHDDLIKAADTAMYAAKAQGRNNYKHFVESMQAETEQKQRIQTMLQRAIAEDEFYLLYQPKVCLLTKTMVGCEALLRWHPHDSAPISPILFIPNAEDSGQINEIGEWVLHSACQQISEWIKLDDYKDIIMSINVSTVQLGRGTFFEQVRSALSKYAIPATTLEIEITETGVMEKIDDVIIELQNIHQLGVKLAIDDFGTGSSSLELLRKLPLDVLKIDKSFIQDIGRDKQDEEIIKVILAVAKTLGLEVIAEGVESMEQLLFLSEGDCQLIQGYYFSKPVTAEQFAILIKTAKEVFNGYFPQGIEHTRVTNKQPIQIPPKPLDKEIRVLICEDAIITGRIVEILLHSIGFEADLALSAEQGLLMLEQNKYDAMTLDLQFGDINGLDFLKLVHQTHDDITLPVIVISAHIDDKIYQYDSSHPDIVGWLSKPVEARDFYTMINEIIPLKQIPKDF
ncbi:MAG: EAL domain-containing protein, partial [Psychrosphaera sp.]|nr:EAL domain-containing protein [Psychrosphaera sp.]